MDVCCARPRFAIPEILHGGLLVSDNWPCSMTVWVFSSRQPFARASRTRRPPGTGKAITGGQLAAKLNVARSTIYKWYRLRLIDDVGTDTTRRHLYDPDQPRPTPAQITAARARARARTATTRP